MNCFKNWVHSKETIYFLSIFEYKFFWVGGCSCYSWFEKIVFYVIFGLWKFAIFLLNCPEKGVYTEVIDKLSSHFAYKFVWLEDSSCPNEFFLKKLLFLSYFLSFKIWHIPTKIIDRFFSTFAYKLIWVGSWCLNCFYFFRSIFKHFYTTIWL